jgi:glucokinase
MVIQVGGPKCGCGNSGCFEALASRTSIFRELARRVKEGEKTFLSELLKDGESIIDLKSGDLRKALRKGDKLTAKVLQEAAKYTGIAVANLVNILSPQTVVLGGGVMDALEDDLMPTILETTRDYAMPGTLKDVEILARKLGDEAGITGAAIMLDLGLTAGY